MKTRRTHFTRRTINTMLAVSYLLTAAANAAEVIDSGASHAVAVAAAIPTSVETSVDRATRTLSKPTISSKLTVRNQKKISDAFELALDRVREVPECRELFEVLGADGMDSLGRVIFLPIGRAQARGNVCRGISAYTLVGGGPVRVCREFARLSDTQAAMVIIHEALHHAGLTEYPQDPDGMTSHAINGMVMEQCGL